MGKLFSPLAVVTNLMKGYSLAEALKLVKECGFDHVEIASIIGTCEHVAPSEMNEESAAQVRELLVSNGLSVYSFSGHVDLTDESQFADFLIKMQFAADIGARIINTNSGPVSRIDIFRKNLSTIISKAEKLGIMVGLESHGDIIDTAKTAAKFLSELNHPLIRLNYDTGNTYYYAGGKIDIAEDLKYGLPYLAHVHLKDIHIEGNRAYYRPIGKGDLNFKEIFDVLSSLDAPVPCGMEIPVFVQGTLDALKSDGAPLSSDEIKSATATSMETLVSLQAV